VWGDHRQRLIQSGTTRINVSVSNSIHGCGDTLSVSPPTFPTQGDVLSDECTYLQYMWERAKKPKIHEDDQESFKIMISLVQQYGPNLSSKMIRYAVLANAYRIRHGDDSRYDTYVFEYIHKAIRLTRQAIERYEYYEIAYALYFLAQSYWVGKSIHETGGAIGINESIVLDMLICLDGFTRCLKELDSSSLPCLSLKRAWYTMYVMIRRLLNRGRGRGNDDRSIKFVKGLNELSGFVAIWWGLQSYDREEKTWFRYSQLKLALYEIQHYLDKWYYTMNQNTKMTEQLKVTLRHWLHHASDILSDAVQISDCPKNQHRRIELYVESHYVPTMQDALIAYYSFLLEYVLLIDATTKSPDQVLHDEAIRISRGIYRAL
jgi:hypothetical protein